MNQLPDLALITDNGGFFSPAVSREEIRCWHMRDCFVTLLPLRCKRGENALRSGLMAAHRAGCSIAAIGPEQRRTIQRAPLQVADGRLLALSSAKRRLDIDCPGWEKDTLCFSADDNFSCLAARWLAPYSKRLHICGQDAERRQALMRLLYRENGLIAAESTLPPRECLLIQPPNQPASSSHGEEVNSVFVWQAWPCTATDKQNGLLSCHLAEGLLLSASGLPEGIKPLTLLRLLAHRSKYYEILPL